jgi:hypothetical protein
MPQPVKPTPAQHVTTFPVTSQSQPYGQDQSAVKVEARPYQTTTEFIQHGNGVSSRKATRSTNQPSNDSKPPTRTKRQEHGELLEGLGPTNKRPKSVSSEQDEDEKRRNFLERNRQGALIYIDIWLWEFVECWHDNFFHPLTAALKCRQRKKAWLSDLQGKVETLSQENEQLALQANSFRDEIIHLKSLLLAHKDCRVANENESSFRMALEKPVPPPVGTASQRQE